MSPQFTIIDAPSILGLRPTGVELLPDALKAAGLIEKLHVNYAGRVSSPLSYNSERDKVTLLLNPNSIKTFSIQLADMVSSVIRSRQYPIVLGGDCSILIGNLLALRRLGRYGLFFIDGHADFYQPEASLTGEVADMDLAIVSGRGPDILTNIDNLKPLVRDEDIILFGYRDREQAASFGSQDVRNTSINSFDLAYIKQLGIRTTASEAIKNILNDELGGFWIHLDADVLDDAIMPAVDYRLKGGLSFYELSELLKIIVATGRSIGMDITIFNPNLDPDGFIARRFVSAIVKGISS
ncbi:MAG TPA: arginase family protein [Nitrososphaeraceae archaeon]|nr:arginase family protein [Nitrososphaeraceae archaeon]